MNDMSRKPRAARELSLLERAALFQPSASSRTASVAMLVGPEPIAAPPLPTGDEPAPTRTAPLADGPLPSASTSSPDFAGIPAEFLARPDQDEDGLAPPPAILNGATIDRGLLAESGMIVPGAPVGPLAEEFRLVKRQLFVNRQRIAATGDADKARTMLVCSARPGDGKTFCAINLALSIAAERDTEVLLVDADVAKPDVCKRLGLRPGPGLLDVLYDGSVDPESLVVETDVPQLSVLAAGAKTAMDTELLASARTRAVIARLLAANPRRLIIFDSPPALAASPAAVLAMLVGQVMLVVRADRTPESEVAAAVNLLNGCEHIGLVLNAVSFVPDRHRFGSYYGQELTQP